MLPKKRTHQLSFYKSRGALKFKIDWFFPEDGIAMAFFTAWVNPSHQTQDCRRANMKLNWWFSKNSNVESHTIKSYHQEIKQQDQNDSKIAPKILNSFGRSLCLVSVWVLGFWDRTLCILLLTETIAGVFYYLTPAIVTVCQCRKCTWAHFIGRLI